MKIKNILSIFWTLLVCSVFGQQPNSELKVVSSPSQSQYTQINPSGETVIPNGRIITPCGKTIEVAPHPFGLTLSNDGNIAVTANSGTSPISITIIKNLNSEKPDVMQIPPGASTDNGVLASVFMGLAISPDNRMVYVAGGQTNKVYLFSTETGEKLDSIDCSRDENGQKTPDGYLGDLKLSKDGKYLFVVDQMLFRMLVIDTHKKKITGSAKTGRYPFGIILSPDEKKVYVANVGMFEYSKIGDIESKKQYDKALDFPPFGFGSEEMIKGTRIDSMDIPGLGDPNAPESFSVWSYSVIKPSKPEIQSKIKTGVLVGEKVEGIPAVGGASPNSLAATDKYIFVSNGTNDNISVIDLAKDTIAAEISLKPEPAMKQFRGVIPFGLSVSPDQKRLYFAEAGINAVAVIHISKLKVLGQLRVGLYPY